MDGLGGVRELDEVEAVFEVSAGGTTRLCFLRPPSHSVVHLIWRVVHVEHAEIVDVVKSQARLDARH